MDIASLTVGLVDQSVRLILRLRKVYKDTKELPQALERRENRLNSLLAIIREVQDEAALQTATVTLQLKAVNDVASGIKDRLKTLNRECSDKNGVSKVWHQLARGRKDAKTLDDLMDDLDEEKSNLALVIQLANIGLTKSYEDSKVLLADPRVIMEVDQVLVGVFGEGRGLKIADLIKGRSPRGDGLVAVDKVDIATAYDEVTSSSSSWSQIDGTSEFDPSRVERIIIANTARDNSRMINAPLGDDMWRDLTVKIMSNETSGSALMVNFPMSMEDARDLLDRQDRTAAAERAEREAQAARDFKERQEIRKMQEAKEIREAEERRARRGLS
ncbi:hypothetical protein N431DRAFT_487196 [Stipitochalara longipes BDJ]|nr:hypothetical protein N431DRAFT_487196 [Stipitochalara longipes BDJ]